uniref:Mos1 transposase HTH domain-containing protein n=1 Tax=Mesocestoides corti TaxID=53468 RepID=A0A5K3FGE3_MESCO
EGDWDNRIGLLHNHKPKPHVRLRPTESTTLAALLIKNRYSHVSVSRWLHVFLACHSDINRQGIDYDRRGPICQRPYTSLHCLPLMREAILSF